MIEWNPDDCNCPSRKLLDRIGDRWTVLVVRSQAGGPLRLSELTARIDGVCQKAARALSSTTSPEGASS